MHRSLVAVSLIVLGALVLAGAGLAGQAADPTPCEHCQAKAPVPAAYTIRLGLSGYSPVSYLDRRRAEPGSPLYKAEHEGVTYFFTDARQVEIFKTAPHKYMPAYGGFCAFGCSVDSDFVPDPTSFEVIDGRTHLFLKNEEVDARTLWNDAEEREVRSKADAYWRSRSGR